jgi:guanosine-3',5'-bis(diphosphate) 3'-pyrophosphohydrolase
MDKLLGIEFEKAVRMLVEYFPPAEAESRKPILFHDIRVGVYLYENGYSREIVLGGLLHDAIEWSEITEEMLRDEFGESITKIVSANTKNRSIENPDERIEDLVKRCVEVGKDAMIVKAADTLDSFKYYTKTNNQDELEYCRKNAESIFKCLPKNFNDVVFKELKKWKEKSS